MPIDISGNGATQAIYLQMSGVVIQYSVGTLTTPGIWNDISGTTWPATITNSNPGASTILRVIATQSLTILTSTSYFIVGTTYITFDGSGNTITMSNLSNYPGLIQNGTNLVVGKANIIVQNFNIVGSGASTETNQNGGWLCQAYYGRASLANYITNCTNAARITRNNAGGLFGVYAGSYTGATMFITNCSNSADMTTATQGRCGGICGQSAGSLGGVLTFTNCMNTGLISTAESGGIVGANAGGENTGGVTFTNCTNTGNITGAKSGGIVGSYFGSFYTTTPLITNTITTCTNTGNITGQYAGGIAGWSFGFNTTSTQSITNSYSTGDISGNNAGGIVGANIGSNTSATYGASVVNITNCYSLGPIRTTAGGICGGWDSVAYVRIASVTITNSYSSGALFGTGTGLVAVALTSSQITLTTPATYVAAGAWTDASANASLTGTPTNISTNNPGTTWTMVTAGTPYVLSAYNAALYSPSSVTTNTSYTSAAGLFQSGYTYQILYTGQAANVTTPRVFVSKGTAPFYKSYNSNTFALTKTVSGSISVSINSSTGVLSFVIVPFIISADGASQAIYLRMSGVSMQYSIGSLTTPSTWTTILSEYWPAPTINSNPGSSSVLRVLATEALTMSINTADVLGYFVVGSEYITFDGSSNTITIDTIASYPGFIQNGTSTANGYANVVVQNYTTTISGVSTLPTGGGWLCQSYFGAGVSGNTITGCTNLSAGVISATNAGGIAGSNVGSGSGGVLTITNCANAAAISSGATSAGGIIGSHAGSTSGLVTITKCFSTGDITGQQAGGIAGSSFATNTSQNCIIGQCYSTGNIGGTNAGGITGSNIGYSSSVSYTGLVDISNCYSLGTIATTTGGICGGLSGVTYSNSATIRITNSYSSGALSGTGAGLVAVSLTAPNITLTTPNTYVANGSWTDASANASLTGTPTSINTSNPGSTWTMITTGTPYVLSAYNAALYSPSSVSSFANYTSSQGLFQSGYTYQIVYTSQASNVFTARVFASKGTTPSYNSYNFNTFTLTNLNGGSGSPISATINASTGVLDIILPYPCFLEGTKILCFENNEEVYRPVESLRKGDLVKTICHGYMPVNMICTTNLYNPGNDYRIVNRLYKCPKENYPTLFEDLYITGCHSILVSVMTDDQWENTKAVNKNVFVTDNHFRLIACADEKAEPYNKEGFMNIYHVALDHHDIYMNYGIYANGLLVESCSIECLIYSNMKIMGQDESAVSQDFINVSRNTIQQLVDTY